MMWGNFLILLLVSPMVFAAKPKPTVFMCKNSKIVRTIKVETLDESGLCRTTYTKAGVDKEVGNGLKRQSCMGFLNNIKGNLEKAHWNCKDVSHRITSSVNL